MAPPSLLGPPELSNPNPRNRTNPPASTVSATSDAFMDLMVSNYNSAREVSPPPMGYTENMSATYLSSGNPCLDFFFHVVPDTPAASVEERLASAWDFNALTALKLIFNLRGVRGTGKSDKEGFYTAAFWLHKFHPKTLACNVSALADFGYIKDMPEILYRLLEGANVRKTQKSEWNDRKRGIHRNKTARSIGSSYSRGRGRGSRFAGRRIPAGYSLSDVPFHTKSKSQRLRKKRSRAAVSEEEKALKAMKIAKAAREKASVARHEKWLAMAKKAIGRYTRDPDYKFLYERISDFFAESLKSDLEHLNSGRKNSVSLAAKWCPSIDSSFDRATLLCESIARKVFPKESFPEYQEIEESHYAYRVRDRLRKDVLVPLRKALELPEVYIGANQWNSLPYNRVASVAMKFYKEKFIEHDKERFSKYLEDVKAGKTTIAAGALLPHEIIQSLNDGVEEEGEQVAELQWKRMVDDLLKGGKLRNCMAISDVSGSMSGTPMEVSVALGILVSELSDEPWKGKLITFSANPTLQPVQGESLREKTEFVREMEWGANTDFQKVFDLILKVAVDGKLKEEQMIKKLFVFSDMEFDEASGSRRNAYGRGYGYGCGSGSGSVSGWDTDYQVIVRKFTEKGYGNSIPEIVFWNLRDSRATPVTATQKGVALVSGYSKNLMKIFLDKDGVTSPEAVMEEAISGKEYQNLAVVD